MTMAGEQIAFYRAHGNVRWGESSDKMCRYLRPTHSPLYTWSWLILIDTWGIDYTYLTVTKELHSEKEPSSTQAQEAACVCGKWLTLPRVHTSISRIEYWTTGPVSQNSIPKTHDIVSSFCLETIRPNLHAVYGCSCHSRTPTIMEHHLTTRRPSGIWHCMPFCTCVLLSWMPCMCSSCVSAFLLGKDRPPLKFKCLHSSPVLLHLNMSGENPKTRMRGVDVILGPFWSVPITLPHDTTAFPRCAPLPVRGSLPVLS